MLLCSRSCESASGSLPWLASTHRKAEDGIDEPGVGDGSTAYEKLTSFHEDKTVAAVVAFAKAFSDEFGDAVQIVQFQGIGK